MPIPLISKLSFASSRSQTSMNDASAESCDESTSSMTFSKPQSLVFETKVCFKLKEKLVPMKGCYSITMVDSGDEMLKVSGKTLSLRNQKVMTDMADNTRYKLNGGKGLKMSLKERMTITDVNDEPVLMLRKKSMIPGLGSNTLLAFPGDSSEEGNEPIYEISGNWSKKDFTIKSGGESVATVKRKMLDVGSLLVGKDSYLVEVEGGHDCALLLLLAVAIDEVFRDGAGVITGGGVRGLL